MKKIIPLMIFLVLLVSAPIAGAGVDVNISIGVPPPIVFAGPPDVVVIPSGPAYVYIVPGQPGIYFFNNFWYRFYGGHWFWAHSYDGRWNYIETHLVPRYVIDVPPSYYRYLPPRYHKIRYNDLHNHWFRWDRDRYWDRYDWFQRQYREHERRHHGKDLYHGGPKQPKQHDQRDIKKDRKGGKRHPY